MSHWYKVLPLSVLSVQYEELVRNQEQEIKKIVEFIGLSWNENCLLYQETARPVLTASSWQVRQPIYFSSIGRWKNYEDYLKPLKKALGYDINKI